MFFGAEVTPDQVTWINASAETPIHLTNACLLTRAKKKDGRVVLQICAEPDEPADDLFSVALGVLTAGVADNVSLDVLVNSRMGLHLEGPDSTGAVVHVVGNELMPVEEDDDDLDDGPGLVDMDMLLNGDSIIFEGDDIFEGGDDEEGGDDSDDNGDDDNEEDRDDDDDEGEEDDADQDQDQISKGRSEDPVVLKRDGTGKGVSKLEDNGKLVVEPKTGALPIITHRSGLKFQDIITGSGKKVVKGHNVALQYVLRLENGKVIDRADRKRPFKFRLGIGECVKGFDIGVMGMREGGERHLIVPPQLGYGTHPPPGIPRNSTLYFDVGVIKAF